MRPAAAYPPPQTLIEEVVARALREDLGAGDVTTGLTVPADARSTFVMRARTDGRIAGLACALAAFRRTDPAALVSEHAMDGETMKAGQDLMTIEGAARGLLEAERTALNFVGRLSGVATLTAAYVAAVEGTGARVVCTRKTTPGLRDLEKWAVRCGGGVNHRFRLDDAILIKDNHIAACGGDPAEALRRAQAGRPHLMRIEIEVDTLDQLDRVLPLKPDVVMFDNFSLDDLKTGVARTKAAGVVSEASGGVTLQTVRAIAQTGVDAVSVGALTHSAPNVDVGLDIREM